MRTGSKSLIVLNSRLLLFLHRPTLSIPLIHPAFQVRDIRESRLEQFDCSRLAAMPSLAYQNNFSVLIASGDDLFLIT